MRSVLRRYSCRSRVRIHSIPNIVVVAQAEVVKAPQLKGGLKRQAYQFNEPMLMYIHVSTLKCGLYEHGSPPDVRIIIGLQVHITNLSIGN